MLRITPGRRRRGPTVIEGTRDQLEILATMIDQALLRGAYADADGSLMVRVLGEEWT